MAEKTPQEMSVEELREALLEIRHQLDAAMAERLARGERSEEETDHAGRRMGRRATKGRLVLETNLAKGVNWTRDMRRLLYRSLPLFRELHFRETGLVVVPYVGDRTADYWKRAPEVWALVTDGLTYEQAGDALSMGEGQVREICHESLPDEFTGEDAGRTLGSFNDPPHRARPRNVRSRAWDHQAEVHRLRAEGFTIHEIATTVGISYGSAYTMVRTELPSEEEETEE